MTTQIQKIQTGWKIQSQTGDDVWVTTNLATHKLSDTGWSIPVNSYLSNLSAFVWKWNSIFGPAAADPDNLIPGGGSGDIDASIISVGRLRFEISSGSAATSITSAATYTNGVLGGDFRGFLGVKESGTGSAYTGIGGTKITANGDDAGFGSGISEHTLRPSSPILTDLIPSTMGNSFGTKSDSGIVVWTDASHRVKRDSILLTVEDSDLVYFEKQWSEWLSGSPLTLYLNRDDNYSYVTTSEDTINNDGFIVYKLDPSDSSREFSPQRVIAGFDKLWNIRIDGARCVNVDNVYGINNITGASRGFDGL